MVRIAPVIAAGPLTQGFAIHAPAFAVATERAARADDVTAAAVTIREKTDALPSATLFTHSTGIPATTAGRPIARRCDTAAVAALIALGAVVARLATDAGDTDDGAGTVTTLLGGAATGGSAARPAIVAAARAIGRIPG